MRRSRQRLRRRYRGIDGPVRGIETRTGVIRNDYRPDQLWEPPREARSDMDVSESVPVLYDADERPLRRRIGF